MQTYEELLNKAIEKLPNDRGTGERFEVPTVEVQLQGNQTIFKNFSDISRKLRREPKHFLKYLTKELAVPASFDGSRAVFQRKLPASILQNKVDRYIKNYVICRECKRPDTRLEKVERRELLKCEACGARSSV